MQQMVVELVEAQFTVIVVKRQIELGSIDGNATKTQVVAIGEEQIHQFHIEVPAVRRHLAPLDFTPGLVPLPQSGNPCFDLVAQVPR